MKVLTSLRALTALTKSYGLTLASARGFKTVRENVPIGEVGGLVYSRDFPYSPASPTEGKI